jgi:S-DNA-T family DNA segregation ATPase FtsK/SpoIIIE
MRHLFTQAVGLRLRDRDEVAMVLGDGAANAGALCHKIPHTTPGVGFVLDEDNRPVRVRAGYVSDQMIRTAADRFPASRQIPVDVTEVEPAQSRPRSTRSPRAARSRETPATEGDRA